jgi:hypothetical protein
MNLKDERNARSMKQREENEHTTNLQMTTVCLFHSSLLIKALETTDSNHKTLRHIIRPRQYATTQNRFALKKLLEPLYSGQRKTNKKCVKKNASIAGDAYKI